jgi:hypothetical protein
MEEEARAYDTEHGTSFPLRLDRLLYPVPRSRRPRARARARARGGGGGGVPDGREESQRFLFSTQVKEGEGEVVLDLGEVEGEGET